MMISNSALANAGAVARGLQHGRARRVAAYVALFIALSSPTIARPGESEHESHHPGAVPPVSASAPAAGAGPRAAMAGAAKGMTSGVPMGTPATPPGAPGMSSGAPMGAPAASSAAPGMAGGGMMGEMMEKMMGASSGGCMGDDCGSGAGKTPIYPSLMALPSLTPEQRAEINALARRESNEGMALLMQGHESLNQATHAGDSTAMRESAGVMREGLAKLGAGIAARRVVSEGEAPRNVAFDWFNREMNLTPAGARAEPGTVFGIAPFHMFVIALLIAFALAMVAMYFFKMRRTAALFGRIEPGAGPPPPGSSPPLKGGGGPSSPPAGGAPPGGGAPGAAPPPAAAPSASAPSPEGSSPNRVQDPSNASLPAANWKGELLIESIVKETPSVATFRLRPSSGDALMPFTFVPGQFLNVAFAIGGARMNRSYSISSSPTRREHVDVTVQREPRGAVSRHIHDLLKAGNRIEAGGPVGKFTFTGTEADSVVLIAGGVGITPMMSIMRYLTERAWPGEIFFVYACRTPADFVFAGEVAALQRVNPKLHVAVIVGSAEGTDWKGAQGRITKAFLTQTVPGLVSRRVHLCGPPPMMDAIKAILTELGVPPEQVKTELFGATKPIPGAAGTTAKPTTAATGPLITFSKNSKSAKIHDGQTILELSEELNIGIEFSCRVGTCGVCKVKLTSGEVEMAVEDALEPDDKANGIILACQAIPTGPVAVEA